MNHACSLGSALLGYPNSDKPNEECTVAVGAGGKHALRVTGGLGTGFHTHEHRFHWLDVLL